MEGDTLQAQRYIANQELRMNLLSEVSEPSKTPLIARLLRKRWFLLLCVGLVACIGVFLAIRHLQTKQNPSQLLPSAVYYHRVKKGMTLEAVEAACGRPEYAQQKNEISDEAEAWFYSASDGSIEILFEEGKVKTISRD